MSAQPSPPSPANRPTDRWIQLDERKAREVFPGFSGRFVHSAHMTFVHWTVEAGAVFPRHAHPHEQVVNLIDGEFELTVGGETRKLGPRSIAVIPANVEHAGRALTACRILDVFYPIREDYRSG
ncbi:MAG: cupin domain-containing protein [Verrucomicrobia bacterium]|nr:cupin domain-containing protein [Verrucomicrobiota bacterium]